jgi:hypothetical protein
MSVSLLMQAGTYAEWASFVGELIVAGVILWELDEGRRFNFLSESSSKEMYEARAVVYGRFMETKGDSVSDKSEAFRELIWTDAELKKRCDQQIVLFDKLGALAQYAFFDRFFNLHQYDSLFPHAVVSFWVMLGAYIREREERTGPWWAKNFRRLTVQSIGYILDQKPPRIRIHSASRAISEDLVIDERELRLLRAEIRAISPRSE